MEEISIKLPPYEWHALLKELEQNMCIVNRDQTNSYVLYRAIASQLAGREIKVEMPVQQTAIQEPVEKTFWQKLFNR